MGIADHPSGQNHRPPGAVLSPPWYRAAHRGQETCAFPGACDLEASEELLVEDVPLGFCRGHAKLLESFAEEAEEVVMLDEDEPESDRPSLWSQLMASIGARGYGS